MQDIEKIARQTADLVHSYDEEIIDPLKAVTRKRGNCFTRAVVACALGLSLDIDSFLMHNPKDPSLYPPHAQALFVIDESLIIIDSATGDGYGGSGVIFRPPALTSNEVVADRAGSNSPDFTTVENGRIMRIQTPEAGYYKYLRGRINLISDFSYVRKAVDEHT
jgi:hypothetical protein